MLPRPFKTEAYRELVTSEGDLQVLVRLREGVSPSDELRERFSRPFRDLALAGEWGAMAGDAAPPQSSSMSLLVSGAVIDHRELLWAFGAVNIHSGTFRVIENLVHWLHLNVAPVEALHVHSASLTPGNAVPRQLPLDYVPHPFHFGYGVENTDVLVDVDFVDRIDPQQLEIFRPAWLAWEGLAVQGGFSDATYPPGECGLCIEDELQLTSTGLGASYERVGIADEGFLCLANMLQTLNHRIVAVESVVIE